MTASHKRTAALGIIDTCVSQLGVLNEASHVRAMAARLSEEAFVLQGTAQDRPYFTRTMSQLAHVLRAHGWVEVAHDTLEWSIERGALDGHVLSEVAECHLARGNVRAAEDTLARARSAGVSTDAIYTSLVKAYGRTGQPERAHLMFEQAREHAAVTSFTYPALIAAYASAGDLRRARHVFDCAKADGQLSPPAFTALATASATSGDLAGLDAVLVMARQSGHMSPRLMLTAIRARLNLRQFAVARRLLEDAKVEGMADVVCYTTIIGACHRAGRHREAKRVYTSATLDARLSPEDLARVKASHGRHRRSSAARAQEPSLAA
jgi:pentatricopeptide repeat protein